MANNLRDLLVIERDSLKKKLDAVNNMLSTLDKLPVDVPVRKKGRKPMSAAARKAHSQRMKSFWAAKRKEKK